MKKLSPAPIARELGNCKWCDQHPWTRQLEDVHSAWKCELGSEPQFCLQSGPPNAFDSMASLLRGGILLSHETLVSQFHHTNESIEWWPGLVGLALAPSTCGCSPRVGCAGWCQGKTEWQTGWPGWCQGKTEIQRVSGWQWGSSLQANLGSLALAPALAL